MDIIRQSRILTQILAVIGLWPRQSPTKRHAAVVLCWRIYPYLLHLPLTFMLTALMWIDACSSSDLEHTTDVLYIALTETVLLVKIVNIWWHGQQTAEILREWASHPALALRTVPEHVMWQRAQKSFGIISFAYSACSLSIVFLKSVYSGLKQELPYAFWVPFDANRHYWWVFSYSVVTLPVTCIANITLDMLHCYLMLHIALSFKMIGLRMERLGLERRPAAHRKSSSSSDQTFFEEFVEIVCLHQLVKRYARICERIVSYPILTQIMISAFVLCCSVYRLIEIDITADFMYFFPMFQYAGVMILEIFLPCYYANEITVNSQELSGRIYSCNWIGLSQRNRRFMQLYMTYLKEPVHMRAGPFFEISLQVFSKTMNNAYSLFALLLNMDK